MDVGQDDLLDAYAMLWTARRIAAGTSKRLPEIAQLDDRGVRAEMLAQNIGAEHVPFLIARGT
jgi:predicted RNase H-like nuclease